MNRRVLSAALALLFASAVSAAGAAPPPASHLCHSDEQVVFNCAMGKKTLSFCASGALSKTSGSLQYRFGKAEALELVFPANGAQHAEAFDISSGNLLRGGAHYAFTLVEFKNADTLYQFEWVETEGASVSVTAKGKTVGLKCAKSSMTNHLDLLTPVLDSEF